jgi:hypothetical protein
MRFTTIAAIVVCAVNTSVLSAGAEKARANEKARAKAPAVSKAVTVTGCLERDREAFRLTETSGAQAPKSRSWKSGFLKKRASDLDLVESSRKAKLKDHVGHRDALTGAIADGALHVQSVRHLSASCGH